MTQRRNLVWLIPAALIISFPLWRMPVAAFLAPRGGYDPAYADLKTNVHNFIMKTVTILEFDRGMKTAIINADRAFSTPQPDEFVMETVKADVFNKQGDITHIVAKRGEFNSTTSMLTLIDNVVVEKSADQQKMFTDLLYYDNKKRTVHCPGTTKLVGDNVEINGTSFDYDIEADQYAVGGRVHCIINGVDPQ